MKEFLQVLRRFVPPYKSTWHLSVLFNILSAVLNIFSFAALIPILQILFQTEKVAVATRLMSWNEASLKEVVSNNTDYYVQQLIDVHGTSTTLLVIGLLFGCDDVLKKRAHTSFLRHLLSPLERVLCVIFAISCIAKSPRFQWDSSLKSAKEISLHE